MGHGHRRQSVICVDCGDKSDADRVRHVNTGLHPQFAEHMHICEQTAGLKARAVARRVAMPDGFMAMLATIHLTKVPNTSGRALQPFCSSDLT